MPRCTTNSIRSAISLRGKSTSRDALQPWLSGALSWHRSPLARWRSRCMSTSLRYLDTAVARFEIEGNELAALIAGSRSHRNDLALLRLLLDGVGNDDAALGLLLALKPADDDAVLYGRNFMRL